MFFTMAVAAIIVVAGGILSLMWAKTRSFQREIQKLSILSNISLKEKIKMGEVFSKKIRQIERTFAIYGDDLRRLERISVISEREMGNFESKLQMRQREVNTEHLHL